MFGEEPPADVWPSVLERFSNEPADQRVDLTQFTVPRWRIGLAAMAATTIIGGAALIAWVNSWPANQAILGLLMALVIGLVVAWLLILTRIRGDVHKSSSGCSAGGGGDFGGGCAGDGGGGCGGGCGGG